MAAIKFVFLVMLFIALVCSADGRRGSRRRRICRLRCRRVCFPYRNCRTRGCPVQRYCRIRCRNPCRFVKRSFLDESEEPALPSKFTVYDSDSDGELTRGEFTDAIDLMQEDGRELFEIIDTNSDQKITCDEFKQAARDVADGEPSCD